MPTTRPCNALQPKHPRSFLCRFQKEVANKDLWVLRPGLTDDSIWKLVVDIEAAPYLKQAERDMLPRVCPGSNDLATLLRQLGYYNFHNLEKKRVHLCDVEVEPGRTVTLRYMQYTHVPPPDQAHSVWSNTRGHPHKDHRRRTNHGRGSGDPVYLKVTAVRRQGKRAATIKPTPDPSPKKPRVEQHTVHELLEDDAVVSDLIKQFVFVDDPIDDTDILEAIHLDMDWATAEALVY